jgi:hypothetical protein
MYSRANWDYKKQGADKKHKDQRHAHDYVYVIRVLEMRHESLIGVMLGFGPKATNR